MKTLLVQGDWLLRRTHFANLGLKVYNGYGRVHCGGVINVIDTIRNAIIQHAIDKVVVVWDGILGGLNKYDAYPVLRAEKEKTWRAHTMAAEGHTDAEEHDRYIHMQRKVLQGYFDDLSVRQIDEDETEAIDAIAAYINEAVKVGEHVFLLSREHEFFQAISDRVTIVGHDGIKTDVVNFQEKYGYDPSNDLMIRCLIGMPSGVVSGVKGLTLGRMLKYFHGLKLDGYSFHDLLGYARKKKNDAALKIYDLVLTSKNIVRRNAKLINMRDPILNNDLIEQVNYCLYLPLKDGRIEFMSELYGRRYGKYVNDAKNYFDPFKRITLKEHEYRIFHEQFNI